MRILSTAIDTGGHYANKVYEFCKTRYIPKVRHVFAIKGSSSYNQPVIKSPTKYQGAYLFSVVTDTAKDHIHECLKTKLPGPGYVHFPLRLPDAYFQQLCAETKVSELFKGKLRKVWRNRSHARNEAFDTFVYGIAALNLVQFWNYPKHSVEDMFVEISKKENLSLQSHENLVSTTAKATVQNPPVRKKRRQISKGLGII
jgi:phage terminase large subunit GpA-like protein